MTYFGLRFRLSGESVTQGTHIKYGYPLGSPEPQVGPFSMTKIDSHNTLIEINFSLLKRQKMMENRCFMFMKKSI